MVPFTAFASFLLLFCSRKKAGRQPRNESRNRCGGAPFLTFRKLYLRLRHGGYRGVRKVRSENDLFFFKEKEKIDNEKPNTVAACE